MSRRSSRVVPPKELPHRIKSLFHTTTPIVPSKKLELIHSNPNVFFVRNFLSEGELNHFDRFCTNRCAIFKNSFTEDDSNNEVVSDERTSMYTYLNKGQDSIIRSIEARAADLCGMGQEHCEPLQIVSYTEGQKFETHHDAGTLCDDGTVELVPPRRLATLFLYLNKLPPDQGNTQFPDLGISVQPERGCGVLFSNVLSNGDVDPRTVHRAAPVYGELKKYGVNLWLCDQSFQELALVPRGKREKGVDSGHFDASEKSALSEAEQLTKDFMAGAAPVSKSKKAKAKTAAADTAPKASTVPPKGASKGKGKGKGEKVVVKSSRKREKEWPPLVKVKSKAKARAKVYRQP